MEKLKKNIDVTKWYESFFSNSLLNIQRGYKSKEQTCIEAYFINKLLQLTPQSKVLDVPCGDGHLSLELASHDYQMTGVDITLPLLNEARLNAAKQQLLITLEHRDMRDLPWQEEFDGAFCFWGSFGYFDESGNVDFLKAVFRTLKPGSRFLIESHIAETLLPIFKDCDSRQFGDTQVIQKRHYDCACSRINTEWIFIREGKVEKKSTSIQIYTYRELVQLLEKVGFSNCEGYDTLSHKPFKFGAKRLSLVATKK